MIKDIQASMQVPPAPAFDGNSGAKLSTGTDGGVIKPTPGASVLNGRDREGTMPVNGPSPVSGKVGVLAPVVGLEQWGSGKVVDAPSSQSRVTPDTVIRNVDPLASDKTPGYGGR